MATFRKRGKKGQEKWEYRISYKDPITQKYKIKSKSFESKQEAILAAAEMELQLKQELEMEDVKTRLKHYLNEWLVTYKKDNVRKNTYNIHERNIKNHIIPYFKEIPLKDVKPIMYQKFLTHLTDQGYSKRTVEIIHGTMYSAMEKAVILGMLKKNPCKGATVSNKNAKQNSGLQYLESENIQHFLRTAYQDDYIYYIFFKFLIYTGMRKGEAAALQWTDIDLKEGTIDINKSLDFQAENEDELFGDPKTYNSKRKITISNSLVKDLHNHMKWQNDNKVMMNDIYKHNLNLVFCRKDGNFMPKSSLFNAFGRILRKADLNKLSIHHLRHTHAVLLLESGADMKYVQERLGHGSIQITSDVYAHISKKIEKDTMDKFEEYTSSFDI